MREGVKFGKHGLKVIFQVLSYFILNNTYPFLPSFSLKQILPILTQIPLNIQN
jgi:hypothetical protein